MTDEADDIRDKDTLLLESLLDVVPNPAIMANLIEAMRTASTAAENALVVAMLQGYGTMLNIIQVAAELDDSGTIYDRISLAYYELTNKDPDAT